MSPSRFARCAEPARYVAAAVGRRAGYGARDRRTHAVSTRRRVSCPAPIAPRTAGGASAAALALGGSPVLGRRWRCRSARRRAAARRAPGRRKRRPQGRSKASTCSALNDFHGQLEMASILDVESPPGRTRDGSGPLTTAATAAGGAAYLGLAPRRAARRRGRPRARKTVTVAAGDLIGATPLLSAAFHDEPTHRDDEPARPRHHLGRQPRVRRGLARAASACSDGGCLADGDGDGDDNQRLLPRPGHDVPGRRLRLPLRQRHPRRRPARPSSRPTRSSASARERRARQDGLRRHDPRGHPEHRHRGRRRGARVHRRGARPSRSVMPSCASKGIKSIVVLLHEGGVPGQQLRSTTAAPTSPAPASRSPDAAAPRWTSWSAATPTRPTTARSRTRKGKTGCSPAPSRSAGSSPTSPSRSTARTGDVIRPTRAQAREPHRHQRRRHHAACRRSST